MEVKKSILVLGINCFPELTGIGKYSGEMIKWFAENGHRTTMVTTPPYYPNWKVQEGYSGNWYSTEMISGNLTVYRCPLYVPSKPSGLKRLIHELTFFLSAFFVVFRLLFKRKHDLIFAVAPPFHLGFLALFYRFFKGGKIVYHIQDLQIEAAKELRMLKPWMFRLLFGMEHFILKKVDVISSISQGMIAKIEKKAGREVIFFPNWVDTDSFCPADSRNDLKQRWGYEPDQHVVLYSGSIGEKQGLDTLIRIAEQLQSHAKIQFLICGTGPYKQELIRLSGERGLRNMQFLPLQGFDVFNEFLNMADVHLILQKANASDLVMPSKLTTILAVGGLALVTANENTTLHEVMTKYRMGLVVAAEDEGALAQAILDTAQGEYGQFRVNARAYAEQFLEKRNVLSALIDQLSYGQ